MDFSRDIVGIVAEYNPFHAGHLRHLQETRKRLGEDAVIVVAMSGYFTQRGEPAVWDKWLRARVAVDHGANLVVELPVYYALSAAQDFAYGGVKLLEALGARFLSFGSEDADVPRLQEYARKRKDAQFSADLRHHLGRGESYPRAMELAGMPSTPNAILGVEYLSHTTKLKPIVVERPQNHSSEVLGSIPTLSSARAMRAHLSSFKTFLPSLEHDDASAFDLQVKDSEQTLINPKAEQTTQCKEINGEEVNRVEMNGTKPITSGETGFPNVIQQELSRISGINYSHYSLSPILTNAAFDVVALASLRTADPSRLAETRGAAEGIEHRLIAAARKATSLEELVELASSKRYTMARIRRIIYSYLLGLTQSVCPEPPRYARILAFDEDGQMLLRAVRKDYMAKAGTSEQRDFTLITKLSRDHMTDPFLEFDIKAAALYSAVLGEPTDEYSRIPYRKSGVKTLESSIHSVIL